MLALLGFIVGARRGDRLVLFLGEWSLLWWPLGQCSASFTLTLALLPVVPLALLAATALDRLPTRAADYQLSGSAWGVMALALVLVGVATLTIARTAGDARGIPWVGLGVVVVAAALVGFLWNQEVAAAERLSALALLGGALMLAFSIGTIGGSASAAPRAANCWFARKRRQSYATPSNRSTSQRWPMRAARWSTTQPRRSRYAGMGATSSRCPPSGHPPLGRLGFARRRRAAPGQGRRSRTGPHTVEGISSLNRADLNPLGILRWVVTRKGLVRAGREIYWWSV